MPVRGARGVDPRVLAGEVRSFELCACPPKVASTAAGAEDWAAGSCRAKFVLLSGRGTLAGLRARRETCTQHILLLSSRVSDSTQHASIAPFHARAGRLKLTTSPGQYAAHAAYLSGPAVKGDPRRLAGSPAARDGRVHGVELSRDGRVGPPRQQLLQLLADGRLELDCPAVSKSVFE